MTGVWQKLEILIEGGFLPTYMMFGSLDNFNFPLLSTQKNENNNKTTNSMNSQEARKWLSVKLVVLT